MKRRQILQSLGTLPLLTQCTFPNAESARNFTPSGQPLRRVDVSDERVIRTIAGLRPYRPSGFNVSAERMNDKVVVDAFDFDRPPTDFAVE